MMSGAVLASLLSILVEPAMLLLRWLMGEVVYTLLTAALP